MVKRVLFRVDGGESVGMGHLVRSRALVAALRERGAECRFVTVPAGAAQWLASRGEPVERLDTRAGSADDARAVVELVRQWGPCCVVTDGCSFKEDYLNTLVQTGVPVAAIDDLAAWFFETALVVNGGLGAKRLCYYAAPTTRLLVGPEYVLLRWNFRRPPRSWSSVRRVLACFGGADPENRLGVVLEAWSELEKGPILDLLVGPAYSRLDELRTAAAVRNVSTHHDLDGVELVDVMANCDMAIASAGMVACELAALGVPMILVVCSEDQRANAVTLAAAGAARLVEPFDRRRLLEAVRELVASPARLGAMGEAARRQVDGFGAERVAEAILGIGGGRR